MIKVHLSRCTLPLSWKAPGFTHLWARSYYYFEVELNLIWSFIVFCLLILLIWIRTGESKYGFFCCYMKTYFTLNDDGTLFDPYIYFILLFFWNIKVDTILSFNMFSIYKNHCKCNLNVTPTCIWSLCKKYIRKNMYTYSVLFMVFQVQCWYGVWGFGDVWLCCSPEQNVTADSASDDGRHTRRVPRTGFASGGEYRRNWQKSEEDDVGFLSGMMIV